MQRECKTVIFNFQENDKDLIETLSNFLDDNAEMIYNFFEIEMPKEKAIVNIIPTKKEYDDLFRKSNNLSDDAPVEGWKIGLVEME